MLPIKFNAGQTLGVCAPASYVDPARLEIGKKILETAGYKVVLHPQATGRLHETQLAGTLENRLKAFHDLIADPAIDGVIFAGGGNRSIELVPHLDYAGIAKAKKPIIGMSDISALLNAISEKTELVTFHGPMLNWLANNPESSDIKSLVDILAGTELNYSWQSTVISQGAATGPLYGGNLAVFSALLLSGNFKIADGAILFLEDISEELNRMDRAYLAIAQLAAHTKINGIIIGQNLSLTDTGRPFGFNEAEIIQNAFGKLGIPVSIGAPFGHGSRLITLPVGHVAKLSVQEGNSSLSLTSCCA